MMSDCIKVLLADRSPLFRHGIELVMQQTGLAFQTVGVGHFRELQAAVQEDQWQLLVLSAELPGFLHPQQIRRLQKVGAPRVLLTTDSAQVAVMPETYGSVVDGIIHKTAEFATFKAALLSILQGRHWGLDGHNACHQSLAGQHSTQALAQLSAKEMSVLRLLSEGMMNKHIAKRLSVHESTVKRHVSSIYRKFQVDNRTGLMGSLLQLSF